MSAILCGKRSSFFEENPSSSSSLVSKRIRCSSSSSSSSSSSPVPFTGSLCQSHFALLDQLVAIFPHMDKKLIKQALENNGHDLDLAIKSLNDLRLGCGGNDPGAADTFSDAHPQPSNHSQGGSTKDSLASGTSPVDGAQWVEFLVREISAASNVDDARVRASKALEAFENQSLLMKTWYSKSKFKPYYRKMEFSNVLCLFSMSARKSMKPSQKKWNNLSSFCGTVRNILGR